MCAVYFQTGRTGRVVVGITLDSMCTLSDCTLCVGRVDGGGQAANSADAVAKLAVVNRSLIPIIREAFDKTVASAPVKGATPDNWGTVKQIAFCNAHPHCQTHAMYPLPVSQRFLLLNQAILLYLDPFRRLCINAMNTTPGVVWMVTWVSVSGVPCVCVVRVCVCVQGDAGPLIVMPDHVSPPQ